MRIFVLIGLLIFAVEVQAQQTPVKPVSRPTTEVAVSRPATTSTVNKPVTSVAVTKPVTPTAPLAHPITQTAVTKPVSGVAVSKPQTNVAVNQFVTTTVVTHPVTKPTDSQGENPAAKKQVPAAGKEESSRTAKTSMSDFKPMAAKDLKAAKVNNVTGGLSATPENGAQNAAMDKMRQSSFVSSDPMANASKASNVNMADLAKKISQKKAQVNKK